jgi:hypothetical protein
VGIGAKGDSVELSDEVPLLVFLVFEVLYGACTHAQDVSDSTLSSPYPSIQLRSSRDDNPLTVGYRCA